MKVKCKRQIFQTSFRLKDQILTANNFSKHLPVCSMNFESWLKFYGRSSPFFLWLNCHASLSMQVNSLQAETTAPVIQLHVFLWSNMLVLHSMPKSFYSYGILTHQTEFSFRLFGLVFHLATLTLYKHSKADNFEVVNMYRDTVNVTFFLIPPKSMRSMFCFCTHSCIFFLCLHLCFFLEGLMDILKTWVNYGPQAWI